MNSITTQIKKLRRYKGYTQAYMGEKLHLSTNAYRKIEYGKTRLDVDRLYLIADVLEVSLTDLINAFPAGKGQIRILNKEPIPQGEMTGSEKKLIPLMIEAKGKEIKYLQLR